MIDIYVDSSASFFQLSAQYQLHYIVYGRFV